MCERARRKVLFALRLITCREGLFGDAGQARPALNSAAQQAAGLRDGLKDPPWKGNGVLSGVRVGRPPVGEGGWPLRGGANRDLPVKPVPAQLSLQGRKRRDRPEGKERTGVYASARTTGRAQTDTTVSTQPLAHLTGIRAAVQAKRSMHRAVSMVLAAPLKLLDTQNRSMYRA